jgi:hypothetical protein
MMGSKGLTHWTSETVYECSEIAGSPQYYSKYRADRPVHLNRQDIVLDISKYLHNATHAMIAEWLTEKK